eukprot:CAMPEP_0170610092 /NCGR_PEP_ID=MMETSP0224-20130122/22469_1 /TAXON_ID=285029 /ORGANISM="Togula jolla, Strain CCCM 725" /LENGTH=84 /DNA_ID=CAMNT_0010935433 /DNA_START=266 /DNA_END=520 /DNA_ORIENTATION=-
MSRSMLLSRTLSWKEVENAGPVASLQRAHPGLQVGSLACPEVISAGAGIEVDQGSVGPPSTQERATQERATQERAPPSVDNGDL